MTGDEFIGDIFFPLWNCYVGFFQVRFGLAIISLLWMPRLADAKGTKVSQPSGQLRTRGCQDHLPPNLGYDASGETCALAFLGCAILG